MKFTFKSDNTNMKADAEVKSELPQSNVNPEGKPLSEMNLDFLYLAYQLFPQSIRNYASGIQETLNKFISVVTQKRSYESIEGKPGLIPASGNDIYNYIARFGMANYQIQTVMKLTGRLDRNKLLRALRLTIAAEPVLGCRFVENQPPYWKPLEDLESTEFCSFEETNNLERAIQKFVESPLDMDKDPMVKLRLISSGPNDTLCIKVNHTCADGAGVKEFVQLLCNMYSRLDQNEDVQILKPNVQSNRDKEMLLEALNIKNPLTELNLLADLPLTMWAFPWKHALPDLARTSVYQLPSGYVNQLSRYAKAHGATINDLILTAYYRAMFEISQPFYGIPMDISMTVDLRRYLPDQKAEAIRNFSGGVNTRVARFINEPFEGTLSRVVSMLSAVKNGCSAKQSAIGLACIEQDDYHSIINFYRTVSHFTIPLSCLMMHCAPVLSNLGVLSKSLFKFGSVSVTDAYVIPPAICAPGLLLCVGSYNDILTMAVSYYDAQVRRPDMERFLNLVGKELMDNCK